MIKKLPQTLEDRKTHLSSSSKEQRIIFKKKTNQFEIIGLSLT